ncbi:IS66 family insertion sequence element accessory protein TnpB [Tissierella praeacuta]
MFCGGRDRMKDLFWEGYGFAILYQRLEDSVFWWIKAMKR